MKSPGDWRRFEAAADAPVTGHEADGGAGHDPVRTHEVAEQLARMVFACVRAQRRGEKHPTQVVMASRFGLLGGLGQGKTSALHRALERVNQMLKHDCGRRLNVAYFDAAKELPLEMEFEFDRLQASLNFWRLVGRSLLKLAIWGLLALALVALAWGLLSLFGWQLERADLPKEIPGWLKKAAKWTLVGLPPLVFVLKVKKFWGRRRERIYLFDQHVATAPQGLWGKVLAWIDIAKATLLSILFRVDVLVVDNLDRASIAQQRALLRAVYKHQDEISRALVVAFDEASLLRSTDHDPEAPEQLLAKAIQVVLRVPDRQPVEAILLTRLAFRALPQPQWRNALFQADVERAFAEVLLLADPLSPRAAKRLLNDSCALLAQLPDSLRFDLGGDGKSTRQTTPNDELLTQRFRDWAPALFRLEGLWQLCPALRLHPQWLCRALECPDDASLAALRQAVAGSNPRWELFLWNTTHLRPANGEWASMVAMAGTQYWLAPQRGIRGVNPLPHWDYKLLDMLWQAVESVAPGQDEQGLRELSAFLPVDSDEMPDVKQLLPMVLSVLQLWSAVQLDRPRAVATLEAFLQTCATEQGIWLTQADPCKLFRSTLARLLVARAGAATPLDTARLKRWLDSSGSATSGWRMECLTLCQAKNFTWLQLWLLLDTGDVVGGVPVPNPNLLGLPAWIKTLSPLDPDEVRANLAQLLAVSRKLEYGVRNLLLQHWPALPKSDGRVTDDAVWADLTMYRCVFLAASNEIFPQALEILWESRNFAPRALTAIFAFPGEPGLEKWDIALAQKLRGVSPAFYRDLAWRPWIEQAGEWGEVRAALFLLLALEGVAALKANRDAFDEAKNCWPSERNWALLVHDAVQSGCLNPQELAVEEAWRSFALTEPELLTWLKDDVLGNVPVVPGSTDGKPGLSLLLGLITPDTMAVRQFADPEQDMLFVGDDEQ